MEAAAIAARFAEDTESTAAASVVANIPAVMNVCRAIDIAGTVSMGKLKLDAATYKTYIFQLGV